MPKLDPMDCRDCGTRITPRVKSVAEAKRTGSYDDCYYHCPKCHVAYSNARNAEKRTKIYPRPELNIPPEVRDHLSSVLPRTINETNRENKKAKFAFETSEDAVTWTVFRYLHERGETNAALGLDGFDAESLLFWGCPWPVCEDSPIRDALLHVELDRIEENPTRLTEPDVIVTGGDRLVFIEVKYRSGNDRKRDYPNFDRYLRHGDGLFARSHLEVRRTGYYELMRNWVIGNLLASELGKPFSLVNLGRASHARSAREFEALLVTDDASFHFVTWPELAQRLRQPTEEWFRQYLSKKGLDQ